MICEDDSRTLVNTRDQPVTRVLPPSYRLRIHPSMQALHLQHFYSSCQLGDYSPLRRYVALARLRTTRIHV